MHIICYLFPLLECKWYIFEYWMCMASIYMNSCYYGLHDLSMCIGYLRPRVVGLTPQLFDSMWIVLFIKLPFLTSVSETVYGIKFYVIFSYCWYILFSKIPQFFLYCVNINMQNSYKSYYFTIYQITVPTSVSKIACGKKFHVIFSSSSYILFFKIPHFFTLLEWWHVKITILLFIKILFRHPFPKWHAKNHST